MTKLHEVARLVRSKNAGPFLVTFDIIVRDPEIYEEMKRQETVSVDTFTELYDVDADEVTFIHYDEANAFKATIPRLHASGSPKDGDTMGGQQHGPLVEMQIDIEV
jgi:hypothetical protein